MAPRSHKTREVDRAEHRLYLRKATDFHRTMLAAADGRRWNSVGLTAVHCVISASDALLAKKAGLRSLSPDHTDVAHLLELYVAAPGVKENAKRLLRLVKSKNLVEYESRNFTQREAAAAIVDAGRYFEWVKEAIRTE